MPVKRRRTKRRLDPRAELEAWADYFDLGIAFTCSWEDVGLSSEAEMREAAPAAWGRVGRAFLDGGMSWNNSGIPWALEEFGEPEQCH